jgi:hypothetical protein
LGLLAGCVRGWARDTPEENRIGKSFANVNGKRRGGGGSSRVQESKKRRLRRGAEDAVERRVRKLESSGVDKFKSLGVQEFKK